MIQTLHITAGSSWNAQIKREKNVFPINFRWEQSAGLFGISTKIVLLDGLEMVALTALGSKGKILGSVYRYKGLRQHLCATPDVTPLFVTEPYYGI